MLEYYGNRLCISARELVESGMMSAGNYHKLALRGKLEVARRGGGAAGSYALVAVESLPERYRDQVSTMYPEGGEVRLLGWLRSNYEQDQAAVAYFTSKGQCGVELSAEKVKEYVTNASVLNECIRLYANTKAIQKTMGGKWDWSMMGSAIEGLREVFGHTLPTSTLRFRKKVAEYQKNGYCCLISGKYGNQSARRMSVKEEKVVLGIAILPNKPWNTTVREMYEQFVCGELDVYDPQTGELLNPDDYAKKGGDPWVPSESTINNYLNKPKNRVLIELATTSWTTFMHQQAPHMHRHAPEFSFSKVSFDDRDLPRKLKDTKQRPKAYYAYDVASQCVVGAAYNRSKTVDIVVDCFRDMFRLIEREGWNCPAQVEVENHLMSQWKDSFLKAGVLFPFVRFCAPENCQEKYAEPMNGAKKRSVEHKNHLGIGRFYAKGRHYRTEAKKVFDAQNDNYEDQAYYTWEQLIEEDKADVWEWNHALHPNQKKYPGMTRWDVLTRNMNPTLQPVDKAVLAKYIGEHVETSIRRNSYCRVQYEDWWLSDPSVLERLHPNDWKVDAYWLPDNEGNYKEVYIYQDGQYVDTLTKVGEYNTADAEQTEEDKAVFVEQCKKIAKFRGYIGEHGIAPLGVMKKAEERDVESPAAVAEVQPAAEEQSLTPSPSPKGEGSFESPTTAASASQRALADF